MRKKIITVIIAIILCSSSTISYAIDNEVINQPIISNEDIESGREVDQSFNQEIEGDVSEEDIEEEGKGEIESEVVGDEENGDEGEEHLPEKDIPIKNETSEEIKQEENISMIDLPKEENLGGEAEKVQPVFWIRVHGQSYGWQSWKTLGELVGTTAQSKRVEAIEIKAEYPEGTSEESKYQGDIEYRVHAQKYGWMPWKKNGETAGTLGEGKRLEGIQIRFTGELGEKFDVYYRLHVSTIGWLGWGENGSAAGTESMSKRVEALEFEVVEKGEQFDKGTKESLIKGITAKDIVFTTHIQNIGDTKPENIQNTLGTQGQSKRIEALTLKVNNNGSETLTGGISYRTHIQTIGWQSWKSDGEMSGTQGQSKRIEAVEIKLIGEIAKYYDIYYRTHVQQFGWLGWAKNGQTAGTSKCSYRMEALQMRLVPKGNVAPGNTSGYYKEGKTGWYYEGGYKFYYKAGVKQLDLDGILPKQSSYYIKVNRKQCTVTVYAKDGGNGYIIPVKRFVCSVGLPSSQTPIGTFYTPAKYRWHTLMGPSYGQYCTRIYRGVLFHSVAGRNMTSYNLNARDYNKLGQPASHGCVRLNVRDAKWIYDYCPLKTKVTIYDSSDPGPLGKPATIKIPAGQTWDPTDPNVKR